MAKGNVESLVGHAVVGLIGGDRQIADMAVDLGVFYTGLGCKYNKNPVKKGLFSSQHDIKLEKFITLVQRRYEKAKVKYFPAVKDSIKKFIRESGIFGEMFSMYAHNTLTKMCDIFIIKALSRDNPALGGKSMLHVIDELILNFLIAQAARDYYSIWVTNAYLDFEDVMLVLESVMFDCTYVGGECCDEYIRLTKRDYKLLSRNNLKASGVLEEGASIFTMDRLIKSEFVMYGIDIKNLHEECTRGVEIVIDNENIDIVLGEAELTREFREFYSGLQFNTGNIQNLHPRELAITQIWSEYMVKELTSRRLVLTADDTQQLPEEHSAVFPLVALIYAVNGLIRESNSRIDDMLNGVTERYVFDIGNLSNISGDRRYVPQIPSHIKSATLSGEYDDTMGVMLDILTNASIIPEPLIEDTLFHKEAMLMSCGCETTCDICKCKDLTREDVAYNERGGVSC